MSLAAESHATEIQANDIHLTGIDYVEFYVGNALQAAHFYRTGFGFRPIAYAGPETGMRDRSSFVLQQGNVKFVVTSAVTASGPIAEHVNLHGDGVRDIAFCVEDAAYAFELSVKRGARPIMEPSVNADASGGSMIKATIAAFGDTLHSFVQRDHQNATYFPNYHAIEYPLPAISTGLTEIDHFAINVEPGKIDYWVGFYKQILGFYQSQQEDIATEYSAMNVKVVQNSTNQIKFTLVEPAKGKFKSQIAEFLELYCGPGVQHVALSSDDIVQTLRSLCASGIEFVHTPDTYYDALEDRIGKIDEDMEALREFNVLVDRDQWGYLMQRFTKPVQTRATLFMEIIQRKDARGFGGGNIKALFEAIEREQALRGNL